MRSIFSTIKFAYICPNCNNSMSVSYPDVLIESSDIQNKLENHSCSKCNTLMYPMHVKAEIHPNARMVKLNMMCKSCGAMWDEFKILHDKYTVVMARKDILQESCINPQCGGEEIVLKSTIY